MNFIHIADLHLGAEPNMGKAHSERRPGELWESFSKIIDICEVKQMDVLLIAGDMFHRQPLLRELKEVNFLFSKLTHTKVVFIAGNHDYVKHDSYYRTFLWNENVYPLLGTELDGVVLEDIELGVYGFSYHQREIQERRYDEERAPGRARFEILLAHGGDERHVPFNVNKIMENSFDYVAFGHIHKPQILVKNRAAFSGALEPVDKNDMGQHGYIQGEISENGTFIEFVPAAKRSYIHLALQVREDMTGGTVRDCLKQAVEERGIEHAYKIVLKGFRDPDILFDLTGMDVYGNILEIADETVPAYDFEKIRTQNSSNLIGKYIESFRESVPGTIEYEAMQEGVHALLRGM